MMKNIFGKFGFLLILLVSACDLDGDLENPNEIGLAGADVNLIMNAVQLDFADFFNEASGAVNPLVRMEAMTSGYRYQSANQPEGVNTLWEKAYNSVLINGETLISLAEPKNLTTHIAATKIMQAYVYLTLVDIFGDVPQSEALKAAAGNFNPAADPGESVYTYAITLLTEAKAELAKTGADAGGALTRDIYYGGNRVKWNALANTLELKAWLNISMIASRKAEANGKIAALLALDLVDTEAENFTYKYGTATVPVSRHPLYRQYYDPTKGNAAGYIANHYLWELFAAKGVEDPRWRYYFYRQVGSMAKAYEIDPKALGCTPGAPPDHYVAVGAVFCDFDPGFYGRDHADNSGTPPDSPVITCAGVYPAGGKIDNTSTGNATFAASTVQGDGANGAGIQPIWMSFYTDYLKSEIKSRAGDDAGAKIDLINGINKSITQVRSFATAKGQVLSAGREPSTVNYLAAIDAAYDAATVKLDVIGREFYAALWGNGVEAYNSYRRTSAPRNLQPTLQLNPGVFFRTWVYPAEYVNLNSSATQKDPNVTNKTFWDTNPDTLN